MPNHRWTTLKELLRAVPGFAMFFGVAWWLTPAGAPASRFWWTLLGVFCVPLLVWGLIVVGYFWMWRRWVKYRK